MEGSYELVIPLRMFDPFEVLIQHMRPALVVTALNMIQLSYLVDDPLNLTAGVDLFEALLVDAAEAVVRSVVEDVASVALSLRIDQGEEVVGEALLVAVAMGLPRNVRQLLHVLAAHHDCKCVGALRQ